MISYQTQQILVPKKVYIGDAAELRVTFNSQDEVTALGFDKEVNYKDYTIQDVRLTPAGVNYYQLTITFIPWKTGDIQFPTYKLQSASEITNINFDPVNIVSIIEQNGISSLRDSQAPLLLPGTTYKLYTAIIGIIIVLIVGIRLIIKRKNVALFFKNQKLLRKYRKNKKLTIKTLNQLKTAEKEKCPDNVCAAEIQKVMRSYLETRFAYPFKNCVTSLIMQGFYTATAGTLSNEKEEAAGEIAGIFVRTDFIRYGQNSYSKTKAEFLENERSELIERLIANIEILEQEVKKDV